MPRILIVDDEKSIRKTLTEILEFEKFEVVEAADGMECIVKLKREKFDVILLDIKMPNMDGMEALERIQLLNPETPVVMISGHATIDTAVDAVKKGAFDFISKPPDLNRLLITLRNAIDKGDLITEKKILQRKVSKKAADYKMIGKAPSIGKVKSTIERVAPTEARVLIVGDNGTGKELVAKDIHAKSPRKDYPFVEVNCAAIPSELIESELFGHEKGAFTSAHKQRPGKFELANNGTLFLDEIGDMSLSAQAKVLRALQESRITRVGGDKSIPVNVRILAATNKDIPELISQGKFREDLYHRLAVIVIKVPRLNQRKEDIPDLIDYFNGIISDEYNIPKRHFASAAIKLLKEYPWTGNIRELRNVVERLIILGSDKITKKDVVEYVYPVSVRSKSSFEEVFSKFDNLKELSNFITKEYETYKQNV